MLRHGPSKHQVFHFLFAWLLFRHHLQVIHADAACVFVLHEITTRYLTDRLTCRSSVRQTTSGQKAQIFLIGEDFHRLRRCIRGDDNFSKDAGDFLSRCSVQRLVQRDDPTKGACLVALEGPRVGITECLTCRHTTWVSVLDDGASWRISAKFTYQFKRRIRVVDVVIRQFFALVLFGRSDARTGATICVKRR